MPDWQVELLTAILAVLFGGGGGVAVFAYKAKSERDKLLADAAIAEKKVEEDALTARLQVIEAAKVAAADVALSCWREFAEALRGRIAVLTDRLTAIELELQRERERNNVLEEKVHALEMERAQWKLERAQLVRRIAELEGCK